MSSCTVEAKKILKTKFDIEERERERESRKKEIYLSIYLERERERERERSTYLSIYTPQKNHLQIGGRDR